MKKYLLFVICFVLTGCVNPKFHENTQEIFVKKPNDTTLTIEGYGEVEDKTINVKRSFGSLKATIQKQGFEDKKVEIESHFTDDKWAQITDPTSKKEISREVSAISLLPLMGAIYLVDDLAEYGGPIWLVGVPFAIVDGIANDVGNLITLSWPRAVIGNSWYEYDDSVDLSGEILKPTPEFEQVCHNKKNMFIGNNECLPCHKNRGTFSTKEECARCPDREWIENKCLLKCPQGFRLTGGFCVSCNDKLNYDSSEEECTKCSNRKWHAGECRLK